MSNWSVFKTTHDRIGMGANEVAQQKSFETLQDMARERVLRMLFRIKKMVPMGDFNSIYGTSYSLLKKR